MSHRRLITTLLLFVGSSLFFGQDIKLDLTSDQGSGSGYKNHWDASSESLVLFRNSDNPTVPTARLYRKGGGSIPIYVLRDFPDAKSVSLWAAASTPGDGVVISGVLVYPQRKTKSVLLTYDSTGTLVKVWEMFPYHHHQLAVDSGGNVFALGDRLDTDGHSPYPMLIKYSPTGEVLKELLPSNRFDKGDEVVASGAPTGENSLFVSDGQLYLWLSLQKELFTFDLNGDLVSATPMEPSLSALAASFQASRVLLRSVGSGGGGSLVAEVRLYPKSKGQPFQFGVVRFEADGKNFSLVQSPSPTHGEGTLVGTTADHKPLFIEKLGDSFYLRQH